MFIAPAMCVVEWKSRRLVFLLQSAKAHWMVTSSFVRSWKIRVNVTEGIQDPENWTQYIIPYLCLIHSSTLDVGIIARECSLSNSPILPEVCAMSLLKEHSWYVPHLDHAGYDCMYQIHNFVLTTVYHSQHYTTLTVMCCQYIIVMQPKQS